MTKNTLFHQLEIVLADTYVVLMQTQNVHWNFTGKTFYGMHQMTESQYVDMVEAIDLLAERIRAIGHTAPSGLTAYSNLTTIEAHDVTMLNIKATCQHLIDCNQSLCKSLKLAIQAALTEEDPATEDMIIERLQAHEKFIWMLTATISGTD